jgi:hypothetical protein
MKRLALWTVLAIALVFGPANITSSAYASSPIFGNAKVAMLTTDDAKKVTAKGYYGSVYGAAALNYLYYAYIYQYYAYYVNANAYGPNAVNYAYAGYYYAYYALYYTRTGQ